MLIFLLGARKVKVPKLSFYKARRSINILIFGVFLSVLLRCESQASALPTLATGWRTNIAALLQFQDLLLEISTFWMSWQCWGYVTLCFCHHNYLSAHNCLLPCGRRHPSVHWWVLVIILNICIIHHMSTLIIMKKNTGKCKRWYTEFANLTNKLTSRSAKQVRDCKDRALRFLERLTPS